MLKALAPQEEHRSRARRKLDAIEGFRGHATIDEDEEEDVVSVDSRTGLVQVFLVNVLILHNPIIIILIQGMVVNVLILHNTIIILIQGMVVNVLAPSDKVISSTTYTEGQVTSRRALRFILFKSMSSNAQCCCL